MFHVLAALAIGHSVGRSLVGQLVSPQKFPLFGANNFCPGRLKFFMEVKCVCVFVCEGVCLRSCQLAKRKRGNESGLWQKDA